MNKKHNEEDIIKLLRSLPPITDNRDQNEVYSKVLKNMNEVKTNHLKGKKKYIIPKLVTVVGLLLVIIFVGKLFNPNNLDDQANSKMEMATEKAGPLGREGSPENNPKERFSSIQDRDTAKRKKVGQKNKNAVYSEDLKKDSFLATIGIPDEQALNVIPVSIIAKKESGKNWVDQVNDVFGQINEKKLGLFDYLPYQGKFTKIDEKSLNLNLENNHQYSTDSTSEMNFFTSLSYLKYQGINKVSFSVAGTPGVHFAHHGEKIYELPLNENLQCGFLYYETKGHIFLTPTPSKFSSIEEAFINMQEENERYHLKPTIPATLAYSVSVENHDQLIFKFTNKIQLEDKESNIRMIEAILLTAKEFGFKKVQFQNAGNEKIGHFNLRKAIEVPVAPNLIDLHAVTP
jgi:hypothetical protein